MPRSRALVHIAVCSIGVCALSLLSCGREGSGPSGPATNPASFFQHGALAVSPQFEMGVPAPALKAALSQVAFERVRIVLRHDDGSIALDTTVTFPAGSDVLTLTLTVPLPPSTRADGVELSLNLDFVNAAGDVVFQGGPLRVRVLPSTRASGPPPVLQIPVHYTGPGANATRVVIAPKTVNNLAGQSVTFTAQAQGSDGTAIAGTPVVFSSSNTSVVNIDASSGVATLVARGTAKVYAQLLTGPADSAAVAVTLPAARIALVSGDAQTAIAGLPLPLPVIARVTASDGIGVGGVTVSFAAAGGGSATPASAVSDSLGNVSAQWKLGTTAGAQTMTVSASGLTGSPITVNATALPLIASRLVLVTGPVSGKAGAALPTITVAAQDNSGDAVTTFTGDVSVAIGTNPGSATLGGTTTVKAVAGIATFSGLTLNRPGANYTLVFSSNTLSSVASGAFSIVTGDAAILAFGPMPASVDAGIAIAPPITVTAQDATGNTITSFTGAVSVAMGTNPGGVTLGGTLTHNAVAGVATFNNLTIATSGMPYTLTASATGLTGATSAAFSVQTGPATGITIVSGSGQSAAAGSALSPITVRLHDAFNNGISGGVISFVVTSGGGTLSAATATTDATGNASVIWTIGAGPQTMTASYTGLSPITITSTSTSIALTWTGATSTAWTLASNWSPAFAPTAVDAVTIPVTGTQPIISTPVSVVSIAVAAGATLTNNSVLTLNGSLDAGTTMTGSGSVVLAGAAGTLKGTINQAVTVSGAAYTLNGATQITGPLTVLSTGKLAVGGQTLAVTGTLSTSGSGRLEMTGAGDNVTVTGNAIFLGGAEYGLLTAGTLSVSGNFTATGSAFSATGSHILRMVGTSAAQTLAFTSPVGGQGINHLAFAGAATKTMSGAPQIMGDVAILGSSAPVDGSATVRIGGNFADSIAVDTLGLGGWRVATTDFFGSNKTFNAEFISTNMIVSGTVQLAYCTVCYADRFPGILSSTTGYVQVNGDVTVSGSSALLTLNANEMDVMGNFATASGGVVDLTNANDWLWVVGSATFGGGSTVGRLTLGRLDVIQDFTQSGAANSFAPDTGFYTSIGEYYVTSALRASRASRARASRAPSVATKPKSATEMARHSTTKTQRFATLRAERAERRAGVDRRAAAYARRGLVAPPRGQISSANSAAEIGVRVRSRGARAYAGTSIVTFANPTSSYFGMLYLAGPTYLLGSDINVTGRLETDWNQWNELYSTDATPRKVTSHGADVDQLDFNNVSWTLLDGFEIWGMDYVEFYSMDQTVDQFTMSRTGDGSNCDCYTGTYDLYYWYFDTAPTTGTYVRATDTNGGPNVLELYMDYPYPSANGGHVSTAGGALITGWPATAVVTWTGAAVYAYWEDPTNWSTGSVPTSTDDVLIPATFSPRINYPTIATTHNLTIESGANIRLACGTELKVYGNIVAPLDASAIQTCEGDVTYLIGDGTAGGNTVVGSFDLLTVQGNYKVSGPGNQLIVGSYLSIDGTGNLTVNGGRVDAYTLTTLSDATLTMTNALDEVFVTYGGAHFNGASSALTAGTLTITDGGLSSTGSSFAASGTHTVVFSGSYVGSYTDVLFADPLSSYFQNVIVNPGITLTVSTDNASYPGLGFNANGWMERGAGPAPTTITALYASSPRVINVGGLIFAGDPTIFTDVGVRFVAGTSNATFNNITWSGFGSYTGSLFTITRPGSGSYTFTGHDFSGVTLGAGSLFVENTNIGFFITMASSTPTGGLVLGVPKFGGYNITWP